LFDRVTFIGIGLIGSSLARAMRKYGLAGSIGCYTTGDGSMERAHALGVVDTLYPTAAEAVAEADLVVVAVPIGANAACAEAFGPHLKAGAIVTDVGSVKQAAVRDIGPHLPSNVSFVPGHPIAGTEHSGPDAGFVGLFRGRWCILTPPAGQDEEAVARLRRFWETLGSMVEEMDAEHHDKVLAIVSHLPHIIAYNIVGTADDLEAVTESEVIKYSASGFRDFTRLAASDPTMWRDVCLHNKDAILEMLARFSEDLASLQRAIRWGDGDKLFDMFTHTRAVRRSIIDAGQDIDVPDFGRQAVEHPKKD
jgi:cyclohexadieny/prephenate dehydrogenase